MKLTTAVLCAVILFAGWRSLAQRSGGKNATPPTVRVGISVDGAYSAIPHRRTSWAESNSSVPAEDRDYLRAMFQVLDEAVAVRVAGQQDYSIQRFDTSDDIEGNYDRLIDYVRTMSAPAKLSAYHQDIFVGLSAQRKFFADWKTHRSQLRFAHQIGSDPEVRAASQALQAAYGQLMAKYPNEAASNKDAFYDYHCALDFL